MIIGEGARVAFRKCVKCGFSNLHSITYNAAANAYETVGVHRPSHECLIIRCSVCGYHFTEPCADATA